MVNTCLVGLVVWIGRAAPGTVVVSPHAVPDLGTLKSCLVVDIYRQLPGTRHHPVLKSYIRAPAQHHSAMQNRVSGDDCMMCR